jgi:RimJ/RimL family protein N-acetyltransferase
VRDFRGKERVSEYRDKLRNNELGFFAESEGKMVGSIWSTINTAQVPKVVRTFMRLMPNEALIHDIVTGDEFRGKGVGPYMVTQIASILLNEYGVNRIVIDVSVRNRRSLRMMSKVGLQAREEVLYISAFGRLVLQRTIRLDDNS